ncbi:MAG: radical SAM protein [Chloroflexia bacterium]
MRLATERGACRLCGATHPPVAAFLGVCVRCLREGREEAMLLAEAAHRKSRATFGLPPETPTGPGVACRLCVHGCRIPPGGTSACGLRENRDGRLVHRAGTPRAGLLHWYYDPLPTNCVADWVCPGHRAVGRMNLAVFYGACSFDCLGCQNWHYRRLQPAKDLLSAEELAARADPRTACTCFFGGDPTPQMPHALAVARLLAARGVRICWETNGSMEPHLLDRALELSLQSGGIVKFDLKAWDDRVHRALTGVTNRRTLENFARAATRFRERLEPPLVVAATLLVPGYVDSVEVGALARFVASFDPEIPYALLAFAPAFFFSDLPTTSRAHAEEAFRAAEEAGLRRVRLGNRHLLGPPYV